MERSIDTSSLRRLLAAGEPVTVLDIRRTADREEWSIPGSTHMDVYDALHQGDVSGIRCAELSRDRPVVTVCLMGETAKTATQYLREEGFEAATLTGGMRAWTRAWNTAEINLDDELKVVQLRRTGKGCLSYLAVSGSEALVIDPSLDAAVYLGEAADRDWSIVGIVETHVHADHLSRGRLLGQATGCPLYVPQTDRVTYPHVPVADGDTIPVGSRHLKAIRSPGHTAESTCYLLSDHVLFTGDTLFLNAVGRPDLKAQDASETRTRAHWLHHSLRHLLKLAPELIVLPCHTDKPVPFDGQPVQGSLGTIRSASSFMESSEETFVETILARIPPNPPNHETIVSFNETGEFPDDPDGLEAGANRCAVPS